MKYKLSDKGVGINGEMFYPEEDVKEFIKRLKEASLCVQGYTRKLLHKRIDTLAGEELL